MGFYHFLFSYFFLIWVNEKKHASNNMAAFICRPSNSNTALDTGDTLPASINQKSTSMFLNACQ
ncbi:conserved hypothetical protein [delta proteobacterium NaphS2]|nr:conserved hypothetical protein [delta proteobacterium NaphS2]